MFDDIMQSLAATYDILHESWKEGMPTTFFVLDEKADLGQN